MKKIKVVQIGLGHDHATAAFDSILYQKDIFEVVGFAVPHCEEVRFTDRISMYENDWLIPKMSVEEAFNYPDLDAVVIETEEENLTSYALMAAKKGLHVHMDKPGGLNVAEFEELTETLKNKKLAFSTGYMYRFNPAVIEAMKKIESGELGEIYSIEAHMDCEHNKEKRQWLSKFPGGMMFYLGCHLIDLIYKIQGEPTEVIPCNTATGFEGVTGEDFGMAVLKYKNGYSFAKTCAAEPGGYLRRQLVICGTEGTIELKPLEVFDTTTEDGNRLNMYTSVCEAYRPCGWYDWGKRTESERYNRYDKMMYNFYDMITGNVQCDYDYELRLYKLIMKICGGEKQE